MLNKINIEKILIFFYSLLIVLMIRDFFIVIFSNDPIQRLTHNTHILALVSLPIFIIFYFVYKKKHIGNFHKNIKNNLTRKLKIFSIIIFSVAILTFIITAITLNKDLSTKYLDIYKNDFSLASAFALETSNFILPLIMFLFALNYFLKKDINLRYHNLRDCITSLFFFSIFVPISKALGLLIYDIFLVIILFIK